MVPSDLRRYPREYPRETTDKYIARRYAYNFGREAPRWANAVTLTGPEVATELTEMRNNLRWPAERSWFVDNSKDAGVVNALRSIKWLWPETNVANADLTDLAPTIGPIGFANLDFMGTFGDPEQRCFSAVAQQLVQGGVVSLTCYRGRESAIHVVGGQIAALDQSKAWSDRRWIVICKTIQALAKDAKKKLTMLGAIQYLHQRASGYSPLCVSVWRCA